MKRAGRRAGRRSDGISSHCLSPSAQRVTRFTDTRPPRFRWRGRRDEVRRGAAVRWSSWLPCIGQFVIPDDSRRSGNSRGRNFQGEKGEEKFRPKAPRLVAVCCNLTQACMRPQQRRRRFVRSPHSALRPNLALWKKLRHASASASCAKLHLPDAKRCP